MTNNKTPPDNLNRIRAAAEQKLGKKSFKSRESDPDLSPEEIYKKLHELEVHQIELEMQNEELCATQLKLEASRAQYFNFYDLAPVGYLTLNEEGIILEANLTAASMLNLTKSEVVRQPLTRFIMSDDQDIYYLHRKALFTTKAHQECDLRMVKADGQTIWIQLRATFVQKNDTPTCCIIMNDIGERVRAEKVRLDLECQLHQAQKVESLGQMAAGIAHHYNNLLTIIIGNLEQVMEFPSIGSLPAMKLSLAMSAANRAAEVGALMLAYLGQTSTRRSPLDLSEAFSQCLDDICADMPPNINVEQALPAFALAVSANSGQLKQILSNLITNAREAIAEQQGTISIFFKSVSPQKISDVNRFPGNFQPEARDYACVEVKDTGCGIAKADIAKLFDPFYSTRFTGRGLGLAVVLGHVKSHNGCITLESRPGHGSIFRVYMPLSDKPAPLKDIQSQKLKTKAKVGKILVVDDEPMIREMTAASIKSIGLEVIEASDGVEAIELFQRHRDKIICVLCDLTMPRMDGWGTLKILREIAPEIPVILASGYNEAMVMGDRHSALPRAFLQKPYSLRDLRNTIQQAIAAASEE